MTLLFLLLAAVSSNQDPELNADLRCLAVLNAAIPKAPDDQRTVLVKGVWYYVGRINARHADYDFSSGMIALLTGKAGPMPSDADYVRCGEPVNARSDDLQRMAQALRERHTRATGNAK